MASLTTSECATCGYPNLREGDHAEWCWTAKGEPYPWPMPPPPHNPRVEIDVELAFSLYLGGRSISSIARQMGVSRTLVVNRFKERGYPRRQEAC